MHLALWMWAACAPWVTRIDPAPIGARDGDVYTHPGAVNLALVGHAGRAPAPLFRALVDRRAQLVVLAGDAVPRSTAKHWNRLLDRVRGLKVLPVAGVGERAGDPQAKGLMTAWEGIGVSALTEPGPWYAFDVHTKGARWRMVVLDSNRTALGPKWNDQRYWIPKVVSDDTYDHAIIFLTDGPGRMDGSVGVGSYAAEELLKLVRSHAQADRLAMVVVGGADVPAVVLPGGRWGEAWVSTGPGAIATHALQRLSARHSLAQGYANALEEEFGRRTALPAEILEEFQSFEPEQTPVAGYWDVRLDGSRAELTLQLASPTGYSEVPALVWSPMEGWRPPR